METIGYAASIFMGLSLGMMGGGGSILTVPILVYLFAIQPLQATSYSLFIVGLTALVGGLSYLKRQEVDLKTGAIFELRIEKGISQKPHIEDGVGWFQKPIFKAK